MGVMICLNQGGLCSPSALSSSLCIVHVHRVLTGIEEHAEVTVVFTRCEWPDTQ